MSIQEVRPDDIWIGQNTVEDTGYIIRYNPRTQRVLPFDKDSKMIDFNYGILNMMTDRIGNLWIGTSGGGTYYYHYDANRMDAYRPDYTNPQAINDPDTWGFLEDATGVLWIATDGAGLYKSHPNYQRFSQTYYEPHAKNSLNINEVRGFESHKNLLWIATNGGGVNEVDLNTGGYTYYTTDDRSTLLDYTLNDLALDSRNHLWIATEVGGVSILNPTTDKINHLIDLPASPISPQSLLLNGDHAYIGSYDGVHVFDLKKEVFTNHWKMPSSEPFDRYVLDMSCMQNGDLWVGTSRGLYLKTKEADVVREVSFLKQKANNKSVHDVFVDSHQKVWIGTNFGVFHLSDTTRTDQWMRIHNHESLLKDVIIGIEEDDQGRFWFLARQGVYQYDVTENVVEYYSIPTNQFYERAIHKSEEGVMYIGGMNGFNQFKPDQIRISTAPYVLTFTELEKLKGGAKTSMSLLNNPDIVLPYDEASFNVLFAAMDFVAPDKNQYAYRINGIDGDWNQLGNTNSVSFVNLESGRYTLDVRSSNGDGVWSDNIASINIRITPPWWATVWFRVLALVVFLQLVYLVYLYRMRRIKKRNEILENQVKERTKELEESRNLVLEDKKVIESQADKLLQADELKSRFFTNISHELRTPLTLTMGTVDQTLKGKFGRLNDEQYANLKVSYRNSERLLKMVSNILDISKLEGGKVQLYAVRTNPGQVLSKVGDFFSSKFYDKHIDFKEELLPALELYLDRDKFETIFVNLIANAFKFTSDGGAIAVTMEEQESEVIFKVSDTGIGIPEADIPFVFDRFYQSPHTKSGEGTGVGLALSKELVELHGATIAVTSGGEGGTTFTLVFQKGTAHLQPDQLVEADPDLSKRTISDKIPITESIETQEEKTPQERGAWDGKNQHILVVEDNFEMSRFISQILEDDFEVSIVDDGQKGLEFVKETKVDLILTDYLMPVMDGFEMAQAVKKDPELSLIPMIFLTARAQEQDKVDVLNMGVDDYLFKPFNAEELRARVHNLLKAKQQRAEYWIEKSIDPRDIEWKEFPSKLKLNIDQYIKEHIKEDITGEDLAGFTGQSERSLQRKVKANTGLSLTQYVKEYRLRTARSLLEGKKVLSVSDAAYAVGFNYLSHFTKNFKERFGKAPSEYLD